MSAVCVTPIKGTAIRVVKVDPCGVPVTGSSAGFVTTGFIQVKMTPQYEDGQEFFERNADGGICVNQKDDAVLKRMQLQVDLCSVDPAMVAYVLSARSLLNSSDTFGFALPEGQPTNHFSLEAWQRVAGAGACDPTGIQRYIYNAWPNCGNVQLQDYTVENGRATLSFMAETKAASSLWGDGPGTGTTWMGTNSVAYGDHWVWNITSNAAPTGSCGPISIT